jgi:rSAM-associated Gly-rich repeat protein
MNTSKSLIAVALQIAACAGLLPKDGKASPMNTGASNDARIGERVAKVRQLLNDVATEQMTGVREVNGVRVNWADWHKGGNWGNGHWRKGGWGNGGGGWHNHWGNGSRGAWGNGGWGNGAGFRIPFGWANIGWPNGGAFVAPGWHKYWWNH